MALTLYLLYYVEVEFHVVLIHPYSVRGIMRS